MKKLLLACLVCSPSIFARTSYIPNTKTLFKGGNQLFFESNYFLSSKKIDGVKEAIDFKEGESFETIDVNMTGSYGFTDRLQGHVGVNFRQNQSIETINNELVIDRINGLESLIIGFKYNWKRTDGFQYAMLGEYGQRLYSAEIFKSEQANKGIILGDNGPYATFGLNATYQTKSKNILAVKAHYHNPGADLSSEILTELEAAYVGKKAALYVGVKNITSLNQDPFSDDITQKPAIATGNTQLYNSINRNLTSAHLGLNFAFGEHWIFGTKVSNTFNAISSDLGTNIIVTLTRRNESRNTFKAKDTAFKEYQVEASVQKIGKTRNVVVIDVGMDDNVNNGMRFDFYFFDYLGGNELIATGVVVKASSSKSLVKILKRYSKKRVEEGTMARGGLIK